MKNILNKCILPQEVRMQTETVYATDGRIYTYPCSFEERDVHPGSEPVKQRGSCWIQPDGTMTFRPYKSSGKKAFRMVYDGVSAQVRLYRNFGEMRIRFPHDCSTTESIAYIQKQLDLAKAALKEMNVEKIG
ncbi:MAG: hypothetical protein MJZ67_07780 [Bacteroidales bacterium]|nr:hypothetical protein [Bacteroidales bacterium]